MLKKTLILTLSFVFILSSTAACLASELVKISPEEQDSFSDNVLLPSPAEVFVSMDKVGETNWSDAASYSPKYDYGDNYLRALNLGIRAADGFLAIQARDSENLGEMIVVILTLAEELLVQETILNKGKTFEDMAKNGQWDELHAELDNLRDDVMREIERLGDDDLALLVSAGGWLEGLRAISKVLEENYDPKASSILYQPNLVEYFTKQIEAMTPEARSHPSVQELERLLPEIMRLVNVGYRTPLPLENIKELNGLSTDFVRTLEKG